MYGLSKSVLQNLHKNILFWGKNYLWYMLLIVVSVATTLPDERVRYWNGYMLFYEQMEEPVKTPVSA